jgi:hypothetical protein
MCFTFSTIWTERKFVTCQTSLPSEKFYEGRLKSSCSRLITLNWNFMEVRWRSLFRSTSFGTSYNAQPTSRKRAADRWSLRNVLSRSSLFMVGKAQKSHGARSELNSVFGFEKVDRWNPIRTSPIQSRSRPMRFLSFSNHEKGAPRHEIPKWSAVCSTFWRSGWSVVRSASLATKEGTSKKRPSLHLHKVPIRIKVSPQTFQTALVFGTIFDMVYILRVQGKITSTRVAVRFATLYLYSEDTMGFDSR